LETATCWGTSPQPIGAASPWFPALHTCYPSRYEAAAGGITRRGGQSSTPRTPTAFYIKSPCDCFPAGPRSCGET
jgi:hypothetical protein